MKWMRERDLLIAQTLAFVQSVSGKKPDAEKTGAASPGAEPHNSEPRIEVASIEALRAALEIAGPPAVPRPQNIQIPSANIPVQVARAGLPGEFRSEIQSRVANFRAHQQRFHREREEYFSTTLAKARAAIGDDSAPAPLPK